MHLRMQHSSLALLSALLWAAAPWSGCLASGRDDAFIGYTERNSCADQLDLCRKVAHSDGCLTDPYNMRTFCPMSCNVPRCIAPGTIKVLHKGWASPDGTQEYSKRQSSNNKRSAQHFRKVAVPGEQAPIVLSSLGVGTYLGNPDDHTDQMVANAVIYSVVNGWNIIDTASNYRGGHGELAVGHALDALLAGSSFKDFSRDATYRQDVMRDMVFVSTKVGFIDRGLAGRLIKSGAIVKSSIVGGSHCMAPGYLHAQFNVSRARLNLHTVDLLYLHNAAEMQLPAVGRGTFMSRLKAAFTAMEEMRQRGHLRYYGLATWECFRKPPGDPLHLNLADVVAAAEEAAKGVAPTGGNGKPQHGFAFVQLPINAAMPEAWREKWQLMPKPESVLKQERDAAAAASAAAAAAAAAARATLAPGQSMPAAPPSPPRIEPNELVTFMEAAKRLRVGVFASGPLKEAELLRGLKGQLDEIPEFRQERSTAQKLLQLARSTPGLAGALVGHKTRENVMDNVELSTIPPLSEKEFASAFEALQPILDESAP